MQKLALFRKIDFDLPMRFLAGLTLALALTLSAETLSAQETKTDMAAPAVSTPPVTPAATAATTTPTVTSADPFSDPMIVDIQDRHQKGVEGDKKMVPPLITDLEALTKKYPDNHLLQAYLGSAYTLASRDAFPGPGKLKFLKLGLQTMDDAVKAAPDDVSVRFIRAVNNYSMPFFVNRKESARNDFEILMKEISDPTTATALNTDTKQAIYYYAGLSYRQLHDADNSHAAFTAGLALDPATDLGKKMTYELARK